MKNIATAIHEQVIAAKPKLLKISEQAAAQKPGPGKWSKKEIIGHLIDSASNNHQRFVRASLNAAMAFPPYQQEPWVAASHYQEMPWCELVEFFVQYNLHLSRLIIMIPESALENPCNIGKENPVTLRFVITDYLRHWQHHLQQILS